MIGMMTTFTSLENNNNDSASIIIEPANSCRCRGTCTSLGGLIVTKETTTTSSCRCNTKNALSIANLLYFCFPFFFGLATVLHALPTNWLTLYLSLLSADLCD